MFSNKGNTYSKLPDSELEIPLRKTSNSRLWSAIILVVACLVSATIGFFIAQSTSTSDHLHEVLSDIIESGPHTFTYNRSFSYPPSDETNRAWRNIFPAKGGFFIEPVIAPKRATFSVFHQLHCLNHLRGGYWANQQAASKGHKLIDEDLHVDIQQSHMRHCIDYIRQGLMCHGDTTLEVVDEAINGVHGFRTEHQCKNWEQLKHWTSEQQKKHDVEQIE